MLFNLKFAISQLNLGMVRHPNQSQTELSFSAAEHCSRPPHLLSHQTQSTPNYTYHHTESKLTQTLKPQCQTVLDYIETVVRSSLLCYIRGLSTAVYMV